MPGPRLDPQALLFGRDTTTGIVSVSARRDGTARLWRRVDGEVVTEEATFPTWFYLSDLSLLDGLRTRKIDVDELRAGTPELKEGVGLVELRGGGAYRWLVLTNRWQEVEAFVVAAAARAGQRSRFARESRGTSLSALDGLTYSRPPADQYLSLTGRTYFEGMQFDDLRRMQFDLETTGLDASVDRIFMIAVKDTAGLETILDTNGELSDEAERDLLQRFVALVRERDPDVFENHSIFNFDIPFSMKRAQTLAVDLALGRDGSPPTSYPDVLKVGERSDNFTRYTVEGREVIDTLHAVRRYGAIVRDMRQQGLKEAARYFGIASEDREYVPGAEIWNTFKSDPERVRRYALDDVREVSELSRLLMPTSFALSQMVPKPYERIATAGTAQGMIEPLLVRAYLANGWSLPRSPIGEGSYAGGRTDLFTSGVVERVVKADVASLYPNVMLTYKIGPASDELGAFLELVRSLTARRMVHKTAAREQPAGSRERLEHEAASGAMKVLINSFYGSLGTSFALFADTRAASEVTRRGRDILGQMLMDLEQRGVTLVEADTDGVLFGVPPSWTENDERALVDDLTDNLPEGIEVEHDGRYMRMYSYAEKNYVLQGYDGNVRLVGGSFRSSKSERYGEQFLRDAAPLLLNSDFEGLRTLYRDVIRRLRAGEMTAEELSVSITLTKTPAAYAKASRREEQYEVLKNSGIETWKSGDRVRYYQAMGKKKKLFENFAADYDPEYYVKKLKQTYCKRLVKALAPDDFEALFGESDDLFAGSLGNIKLLTTYERTPVGV